MKMTGEQMLDLVKDLVVATLEMIEIEQKINISRMQVGEEKEKKENVIFLTTSDPVPDDVVNELCKLDCILSARKIEL